MEGKGERRHRGDWGGPDARARKPPPQDDNGARSRSSHRYDGADPAEKRLARRSRGAEEPATRPEDHGVWPGSGDRGFGIGHQAGARRPAGSAKPDWLLSLL